MAIPACTFCEQYEGVLMATNLDDGDTQVVCASCLPGYAIGMAAGLIGGMTREHAIEYADAIDAIYVSDPRGPKPPPAAKPRKSRRQPPPEPASDAAESNAAATVELPEPCAQCGSLTAIGDADKLTCDGCGTVLATASDTAG